MTVRLSSVSTGGKCQPGMIVQTSATRGATGRQRETEQKGKVFPYSFLSIGPIIIIIMRNFLKWPK